LLAAALASPLACVDTNNNASIDAAVVVVPDAAPLADGPPPSNDAGTEASVPVDNGYLWFAAGPINVYTRENVQTSTTQGPTFTVIPAIDAPNFHDLVFDPAGNLWTLPVSGDQVLRIPAEALGDNRPPPIPDLVITSSAFKNAQSLTFDSSGNLWVMNYSGAGLSVANVVRFDDPRDLFGSAIESPSLTIAPDSGGQAPFNQGTSIAFDGAGNLWLAAVAGVLRIDHAMTLSGQVTAAPGAIISSGSDAYVSAAFDAQGSLWITGARNGYFVQRFDDPGSLTGTVSPNPAVRVHLPAGTANFAGGMGFDADGALWIAMSNELIKLMGAHALSGNINASPSVVLGLSMPPDLATKVVLWPTPAGLPVF